VIGFNGGISSSGYYNTRPNGFAGTVNNSYNTFLGGRGLCNINGGNVTNVIAAGYYGCTGNTISNVIIAGYLQNSTCGNWNAMGAGQSNCILQASFSGITGGINSTINGGYLNTSIIGTYLTAGASYTTYAEGVNKTSGTFGIEHPDPSKKATRNLYHSFVESPTEGDNIYRYKIQTCNCTTTLCLPSYYKFLNKNDHVSVTASNHFGSAYGIIDNTQSFVTFTSDTDGEYDVFIIGTRKDRDVNNWSGVERYKHGVTNDFIC
jgi:hypothetical protein